ncbi:MAG: PAS domain-containing protein [Clostridia bacterium]|nr:PAS domain-containing protein [Clostridia bacterium]
MLNTMFKSIIEGDLSPIVVCDTNSKIVYMNPSAKARYHADLTGKSLKECHNEKSNEMIEKVLLWFKKSKDNNKIFTFRNEKENKDVYMVALRDDDGNLIGYYEKHEYRDKETDTVYNFKR